MEFMEVSIMSDPTVLNQKSGEFRSEHDSIGERAIPKDAYYGVQSLRAAENFHSLRHAADMRRTACHLPEEEAKMR